jgi:hypothetical protein
MRSVCSFALALLVTTGAARAQEALCLIGDGNRILLQSGLPAKSASWAEHPVSWFFIRGDGTQQNFSQIAAAGDDASAFPRRGAPARQRRHRGRFRTAHPDHPCEGMGSVCQGPHHGRARAGRRAGEGPAHRILQDHLRSGPGGDSSPVGKTGQAVEIRSLMDPTVTPPGSDVALRAFSDGGKVAGAHLTARHIQSGRVQELTTNTEGIANLHISDAGLWRIEFHRATKLAGDPEAEWELRTATLTFTSPAAAQAEKP